MDIQCRFIYLLHFFLGERERVKKMSHPENRVATHKSLRTTGIDHFVKLLNWNSAMKPFDSLISWICHGRLICIYSIVRFVFYFLSYLMNNANNRLKEYFSVSWIIFFPLSNWEKQNFGFFYFTKVEGELLLRIFNKFLIWEMSYIL